MKYPHKLSIITLVLLLSLTPALVFAGPASNNFQLKEYGFGAGGTASASSANYFMHGTSGEVEAGQQTSNNYKVNGGLTYTMQANVPPAPTLSNNSGAYYNKLTVTLGTGGNASSTEFAVAVSPDAFASTTRYVQADNTLGASTVWQTNTVWGASGFTIIGLTPGTTYSVKVSARMGRFTQSPFGPVATQATASPTFSFSLRTTSQAIPPYSVSIGSLVPASVTTSSDTIDITISSNNTGGANVYLYGANAGLTSTRNSYTISSGSNDLTAATEGYGARATTVGQSAGGPMQKVTPYDGAGNNVGSITSTKRPIFDSSSAPVTTGTGSFQLKAKASATAPAGTDYTDTLTVVAAGSF